MAAWQRPSSISSCRGNPREAKGLPAAPSHAWYEIRKTAAPCWLSGSRRWRSRCLGLPLPAVLCAQSVSTIKQFVSFSRQPQEAVRSERDGKEQALSGSGGDLAEKTNGDYPQTKAETNCAAAGTVEEERAAETNKTTTTFATAETTEVGCSSHHRLQHEPSETRAAIPGEARRKEPDLESDVRVGETAVPADSENRAGLLPEGQPKVAGEEAAAPAGSAQGNQRSRGSRAASPLLQEVNTQDGSVQIVRDHVTHCPVVFQNSLLYELD